MGFRAGQRVQHTGAQGDDPTVYQDLDAVKGLNGIIEGPGTGGWEWKVSWENGERFMADARQLRAADH